MKEARATLQQQNNQCFEEITQTAEQAKNCSFFTSGN